MNNTYLILLSLGGILLAGQVISTLGQRSFLPRVTLLLIFGAIIGEQALDIIPHIFTQQFEVIAEITLMMVGFLIGGKLTRQSLNNGMSRILWISLSTSLLTAVIVSLVLILAGVTAELAIVLGCIASATAPAATLDVVQESGTSSRFSELLISVVALDDAWALILFGIGVALATSISGHISEASPLLHVLRDVGGAIVLGITLGLPAAYLTGRIKPGEPILTEALGLVFICGGLALWLDVSYIISAIVMGAVVANLARHHEYPFHAIENIEWPFMVIFFVLAGASIEFTMLMDIGLIGSAYILSRILGKIMGARTGARISHASTPVTNWMGIALLPQAGVAIGMALVASHYFPEQRHILLPVVISSTVFFELLGPACTRFALHKCRNANI